MSKQVDLMTEYTAVRMLNCAVRYARLALMGAPAIILQNEFDNLQKKIGELRNPPIIDVDQMQGSINWADHCIMEGIVKMYGKEAILEKIAEVEKEEAEDAKTKDAVITGRETE